MDLVYVLKNTPSEWGNNELRFSLRTLEKYGRGYERIYIVGGKPNFIDYNKVTHLQYSDTCEPAVNIFKKLIELINCFNVSDDFILFNDDFYLLKELHLDTIPYYYKRVEIATTFKSNNTYNTMSLRTRDFLLKNGKSIYDFKLHYPIIYNKYKIKGLEQLYNDYILEHPDGLSLRDLYCNWYNVPNKVFKKDVKIMKRGGITNFLRGLDLFSGSNKVTMAENQFLGCNFRKKSRWEL